MRKDARETLQRVCTLITNATPPGQAEFLESPTETGKALDISKSTAHAALERLKAIATATGRTPLETATAIHASPIVATGRTAGPATLAALAEAGVITPTTAAALALAPGDDTPEREAVIAALESTESTDTDITSTNTESPDMLTAPAAHPEQLTIAATSSVMEGSTNALPARPVSVPATGSITALLGQAAKDIESLASENAALSQKLADTLEEVARARTTATIKAKPAADVTEDDQRHVPAPIANWTPMLIEPALEHCARAGWPVALVGPPGCGKSEVCRQTSARLGRPYIRVACSDGATVGDIVGRREVSDGATRWQDGPLIHGARRGFHVTLDELGAAPASVLASVHDLAATGSAHIPATRETIHSAGGWWLTATSNFLGSDRVDTTHEQPISAALADRFIVFQVDYGSDTQEAELAKRVLGLSSSGREIFSPPVVGPTTSAPVADMAALLSDLRAAEKSGDVSGPYSRRRLIDLVRLWLAWGNTADGQALALRGALLDRHPPSQQDIVKGLIQRRLAVSL